MEYVGTFQTQRAFFSFSTTGGICKDLLVPPHLILNISQQNTTTIAFSKVQIYRIKKKAIENLDKVKNANR